MSRVLAISPHLDDAVFSAGGTLAAHADAGDVVTVVTCFTGSVANPAGFALACQLDKGLDKDADYMALRRAEDVVACAAIGARCVHLPLLEAPHRGYENAAALFGALKASDDAIETVAEALRPVIARRRPDIIYGPCGVGGHVDHLAVREALARIAPGAVLWEDFPYAMREAAAPRGIERACLSDEILERKTAAVLAYRSQIGFQFGSSEDARRTLARWRYEGFAKPAVTASFPSSHAW
ncbi:PIG-L deacetylase family protein [Aurantiacibacter spongiae]|uniref:PIG-L deacetylase family protein n=1 Tax=Aurantiacibacter spongiae TaxID=2488860 RepID=UPI0013156582|nr:PIG-L family deacetylase [Aurantiacibacter spongiae]